MHCIPNKDPKSRDFLYVTITDRRLPQRETKEFLMSFHQFCLLVREELRQIDAQDGEGPIGGTR